jgi:PAS domain S-box-containing protein
VSAAATHSRRRRLAWPRLAGSAGPALIAKRGVQFSLLILIALLLAVLATGLLATYTLYRSAEDRYADVVVPLRALTRDVLFQMEREETGVRGYMITKDRRSLNQYFVGRKAVAADLRQITTLTREHPLLASRLRKVRQQVTALHGFYDKLIVFVADGRLGQKQAEREVLFGDVLARQFRGTAGLMQGDIDRFVQTTRDHQHTTFVRTLAVLSVGGFLALLVAGTLLVKVPERLRLLYAAEEEERVRAEQGANAARALAHVSDAVLLVDDDGAIRSWNEAGEQLFGISASSAVGRPAVAVVPEYERLLDAARRQDRFVPVQIEGTERWLAPALSTFEGGRVLAIRDATAGHQLERARADFVATASHELRTPLTTVYGGARTLIARGDQLDRAQQERLLHMIEQESEHLVQIVDQLLVSAQLDRGSLQLDMAECNLEALCAAVVESARLRAPEDIEIVLDAPGSIAPYRCDESLLRQVLVNLVENALKYARDGGRVEMRLAEKEGRIRIDVQDEGPGIPLAEQEWIFEKFYRLDAGMTRGVGGSGLGLYISREIVSQMGGSLSVRSAAGEGSTFTVALPARDETD